MFSSILLLSVALAVSSNADSKQIDFLCKDPQCSVSFSTGSLLVNLQSPVGSVEKDAKVSICGKSVQSGSSILRITSKGNFHFVDASFVAELGNVDLKQLRRFPLSRELIKSQILNPSDSSKTAPATPLTESLVSANSKPEQHTSNITESDVPPQESSPLTSDTSDPQPSSTQSELDRIPLNDTSNEKPVDGQGDQRKVVLTRSNKSPDSLHPKQAAGGPSMQPTKNLPTSTNSQQSGPDGEFFVPDTKNDNSSNADSLAGNASLPSARSEDSIGSLDSPKQDLQHHPMNETPTEFNQSSPTISPSIASPEPTNLPRADPVVSEPPIPSNRTDPNISALHSPTSENVSSNTDSNSTTAIQTEPDGVVTANNRTEGAVNESRIDKLDHPVNEPDVSINETQNFETPVEEEGTGSLSGNLEQNSELHNVSVHDQSAKPEAASGQIVKEPHDSQSQPDIDVTPTPGTAEKMSTPSAPNASEFTPDIGNEKRSPTTESVPQMQTVAADTGAQAESKESISPEAFFRNIEATNLGGQPEEDVTNVSSSTRSYDSTSVGQPTTDTRPETDAGEGLAIPQSHDHLRQDTDAPVGAKEAPHEKISSNRRQTPERVPIAKQPKSMVPLESKPDNEPSAPKNFAPTKQYSVAEGTTSCTQTESHQQHQTPSFQSHTTSEPSNLSLWVDQVFSDLNLTKRPTNSPLTRILLRSLHYFTSISAKFVALLPDHVRLRTDSFLKSYFSLSVNVLVLWMLLVVHCLLIWLAYRVLVVPRLLSSTLESSHYLDLKEQLLLVSNALFDQERQNSHLAERSAKLLNQLQQEEHTNAVGRDEHQKKISTTEKELSCVTAELHETQSSLNMLKNKFEEESSRYAEKLRVAEFQIDSLQKQNEELASSYEQHIDKLTESHKKQLDDFEAEREELQNQILMYHGQIKPLQHEIDKLRDVCQQAEQNLASTETELSCLQTVFTTLKSFDQVIQELDSRDAHLSNGTNNSPEYADGTNEITESAEDSVTTDSKTESCDKLKAYLSRFLDVGRLQADLELARSQVKIEENKVSCERELREQLESKLEVIERVSTEMRAQCQTFQEEKAALATKLEVLSTFFKERELELQKDLGKHLMVGSESTEALAAARKRNRELEVEVKTLRDQLSSARRDLAETERASRRQIAELDRRSHENWLAARTADHQIRELRNENASLRQRLVPGGFGPRLTQPFPAAPLNSIIPRPGLFTNTVSSDRRSLSGQSLTSSSSAHRQDRAPPFPFPPPPPDAFAIPNRTPSSRPSLLPPPPPFLPYLPGMPPPPPPPPPHLVNQLNLNHSRSPSIEDM